MLSRVIGELKGRWQFDVDGKSFTLTTRIDRMEIGRDGAVTLIDYKTGYIPTQADITRGLANQLPLEALIAHAWNIPWGIGRGLEYWKLAGQCEHCEIKAVSIEGIGAKERLEALIRRFDDVATPYAAPGDPSLVARYNDYEHLTRREEWEAVWILSLRGAAGDVAIQLKRGIDCAADAAAGLFRYARNDGNLMNPLDLPIQPRNTLVKLKRAVEEIADVRRQDAVKHAVVDEAGFLEIEAVMPRGFLDHNLAGKHGALHHDPRHDRRQAQRNARHFARINRAQMAFEALLVVFAEQGKIFMRIGQKLHGFIEDARHEKHVLRLSVGDYRARMWS